MVVTVLIPLAVIGVACFLAYRSLRKSINPLANKQFDNVILEIKVPKETDEKHIELQTAPIASEQMFASIHGLLRSNYADQEHISFEMTSSDAGIRFFAATPPDVRSYVENQIYAQYPHAVISEAKDYVSEVDFSTKFVAGTNIYLAKDQIFPIKTFKDFEVDPISAITSALSEIGGGEQLWFQVLVRPVPDTWQKEGYTYINSIREGLVKKPFNPFSFILKELMELVFLFFKRLGSPPEPITVAAKPVTPMAPKLTAGQELEIKSIENKLIKMGFETIVRVVAVANNPETAKIRLRSVAASLKQFSTAHLNSFAVSDSCDSSTGFIDRYKKRMFPEEGSYVLNIEELASIYHLPASTVETPAIAWSFAKKGEPPLNLPTENCTFFAETTYRNRRIKFGIKDEDRRRHMYLIGKSGTGKSTLFRNMILQDIHAGRGVGVLDPHGTLIDEILESIPDERIEDVVYFDPSDADRPPALNMLEVMDPTQKNLMGSGIVAAIKHHFGQISWGPRLEYLLNICILTLLEVEGTTLLGLTRLLVDDNYRKFITYYVKDPVLKDFWEREFKEMKGNQKLITEAVAPIQNKIGRFLSSSTIRNILGQAKSTIRIDEIMNTNKIFLVNLSKGKIGEDNANLLGSLLVSRMQFVALQRAKLPESERKDFFLFVDEFQNFAAGSFESILSEARKYRLCLHLTHQYTAQLPEEILDAVFGNVGTIVSFALGAPDAEALAMEFAPVFDENDLISLERQHICLKLMIDGMTSAPFSAKSLQKYEDMHPGNGTRAVEASRAKYGRDRDYVEEKIRVWVERKFDLGMAIAEANRAKSAEQLATSGEVVLNGER